MFLLRLLKILFFTILLLVVASFSIPYLIDLDKYSGTVLKTISKNLEREIEVNGPISLSVFPSVKITFPDFAIYDDKAKTKEILTAQKIVVYLPVFKYIMGQRDFEQAEIYKPKINSDSYSSDLFKSTIFKGDLRLKKLKVIDGIIYSKSNEDDEWYRQINLDCDFTVKPVLNLSGTFFYSGEKNDLSFKVRRDENFAKLLDFNLKSSSIDASFNYNETANDSSDTQGIFNISVKNPFLITSQLAKVMPFLTSMEKRGISKAVNISGNVNYNGKSIAVDGLKIQSEHTNGTGNFKLFLNNIENQKEEINFEFENIDLNEFISFAKDNTVEVSADAIFIDRSSSNIDDSFVDPNILKKSNFFIKILAKNVSLQKINLQNFNLEYDAQNGSLNNAILDFNIQNNELSSKFSIYNLEYSKVDDSTFLIGEFLNQGNNINETLDLFNLSDYINIREEKLNYEIKSKIIFSPKEISIFDLNGTIGENGDVSGNIATKQEDITSYKVDLKFNNLKLMNFDLPLFESKVSSLLEGSREDRYIAKFVWFRTLTSIYDLKFAFENTELKGNKIENLTLLCNLSPANFALTGAVKSNFAEGNFLLKLTAFSIMPTLSVKIDGSKLDYNFLKSLSGSSNAKADQVVENKANQNIWDDTPIDAFAIYKFYSNFDINLLSFNFSDYLFDNFSLVAHTAGESLFIDNFQANIAGATLQTKGNVSFFNKLLYQFSFTATDFDSKNLLNKLSPKINVIKGPVSFAGSIVSEGNSIKELVASTNLSANFVAANLTLNGVDVDGVVDLALEREKITKDKVLERLDNLLSDGSSDIIDFSGNINVANGVLQSKNITFRTRFSSSITALYADLNNFGFSSNSQFSFLTYDDPEPLSYNIMLNGNIGSVANRKIENTNLLKYIKGKYNIVTAEDILEARKASKLLERSRMDLIENPSDKDYLYFKLQEQKRLEKEKEEEAAVLRSLTANTNDANSDNSPKLNNEVKK